MFRLPFLMLISLQAALMASAAAQSVVRGPYLQQPDESRIVVRWRTDVPTSSRVEYTASVGESQSRSNSALTTEHEIALTGLLPDTRYNYTVGTTEGPLAGGDIGSGGDGEHHFTTSPAGSKDTRVWVIGDSGTADANAAAVRDAYKSFTGARGTDVWLMLGDNAYNIGSDIEYQAAVFDMYPQLLRQVPVWSALGNHDAIDMVFNPPGAYPQIFTFPEAGESGGVPSGSENYYSWDYGDIHFISLDSSISDRTPASPMWAWLAADLAANSSRWTIAFWHHPHYSKGSHDSDAEIVLTEMRSNALPLLEAAGVDLVLTGHSHSYERSFLIDGHYGLSAALQPAMIVDGGDGRVSGDGAYLKPSQAGTPHEGAVHAVVGSSGKTEAGGTLNHPVMVDSMLTLGSMVLDVSGSRLDAIFLDATGTVRDEFTIIKDPPDVVQIDVSPWDAANEVKPASNNLLAVAIHGMSAAGGDAIDFDAEQVNPLTVRLGVGEAPNVAVPWLQDVDGDEQNDMIVGFDTSQTGIFCNDVEVTLTGETLLGKGFVGTDAISAVDCADTGCHP